MRMFGSRKSDRQTVKYYAKLVRNRLEFYFGHNKFQIAKSNAITYGKNSRFRYCKVIVHGNNNNVLFGRNCNFQGLHILIEGNNNTIEFGDCVTVNASKIQPTVINAIGGTNIKIGMGSLFSNNIEIHSSDYHGIYNKNGERINPDKDIIIGKNVWIGLGCKVLKGSVISDGSVVGAGSLVSGSFSENNVIIVGNPARIIKNKIFWKNERNEFFPVPNELKEMWDGQTGL